MADEAEIVAETLVAFTPFNALIRFFYIAHSRSDKQIVQVDTGLRNIIILSNVL